MDLTQLASIVKSVAGIGVLAAVIYLAVQLRQQNRLARQNTHRSLGEGKGLPVMRPGAPDALAGPLAELEAPWNIDRESEPERKSEDG
jgi:hypothetical protein